jgi:fructosamine-3-kinase
VIESLPADLLAGLDVRAVRPLSGGDIARAFRLETVDGPLFAKTHDSPPEGMFAREASGLRALRDSGMIDVPAVVRATDSGLVLEWVDESPIVAADESAFGRALAGVHAVRGPAFGSLDGARQGYLGSQPIDLTPTADWAVLYVERRLRPLVTRAVAAGHLDAGAAHALDRAAARADRWCGPPEPPALLHGDLWAGNRLVDGSGRNWLIDPASHWGHREVDLAMMRLFGGFGPPAFGAYAELSPLAEGWEERVEWYQLAPLLVHVLLFGGGYCAAVTKVLARYAR